MRERPSKAHTSMNSTKTQNISVFSVLFIEYSVSPIRQYMELEHCYHPVVGGATAARGVSTVSQTTSKCPIQLTKKH